MAATEASYFTAIAAEDAALVGQLIASRKSVNEISSEPQHYGRTPLHLCVWQNFVEGAKLLLDAGADINSLDQLHDTPFLLCGAEGRLEILTHLYKNAERTMKFGSQTSQRWKTSVPDYTIVNRFGGSALIPACERGHVAVVALLLEKGMDANHQNHYHWTGLLEAIVLGGDDREHVDIVSLLIKGGADVNLEDGQGQTPLSLAKRNGYHRIAALLSAAGAHE